MLVLPQIGMARSIEPEHKVELDAMCDWVEASLAFAELTFISGSKHLCNNTSQSSFSR